MRYFAIFVVSSPPSLIGTGVGVADRSQLAKLSRKSIPLAIVGGYLPADRVIEQPQWGSVLGRDASIWKTPECGFFLSSISVFDFIASAAVAKLGTTRSPVVQIAR